MNDPLRHLSLENRAAFFWFCAQIEAQINGRDYCEWNP